MTVSGCGSDAPPSANQVPTGESRGTWQIAEEPTITIGEEGVPQYEFGEIVGLGRVKSGEWVIYDRGSSQLRFYKSNGEFSHSVGRQGEGPGEFRNVYFFQIYEQTSIYTYDYQLRRLTEWHPDGKLNRSVNLFVPSVGTVLWAVGRADRRSFVWMNWVTPACRQNVVAVDTVTYYLFDLESRLTRSKDVPVNAVVPIHTTTGRSTWGSNLNTTGRCLPQSVPFSPRPLYAVGPGELRILEPVGVKLIRIGLNNGNRTEVQIPIPRKHLTRSIIDDNITTAVAITPRDEMGRPLPRNLGWDLYERRLRELPYPDSMPAADQLLIDHEGLTWLRIMPAPTDIFAEWLVLNDGGQIMARLQLPSRLRAFEIGIDYVAGVERDSLDVPKIVVRRLHRGD
ncbi:MAG: 6-bladed beta-propeller [Gemmatimonadota bacterium]